MKFEDALTQLEEIIKELEKGELSLDETLQIFEEGIRMSTICSKQLKEAELKVEKCSQKYKSSVDVEEEEELQTASLIDN